jgi:hypothetical protein
VTGSRRCVFLLLLFTCLHSKRAVAQIDPVNRQLFQFGYNIALEGHPPPAAYAFYYLNKPDFPSTNLTLRMAVAPTYLDSELGIRHVLGELTDLGIGVEGGGFEDSYYEINQGTYLPSQSFDGYGGGMSLSLYHLFNPGHLIPLNGMLRGIGHFSTYDHMDSTAPNFEVPPDHGTFSVRTGLRLGGKEPTLYPSLAMELSIWYEGMFQTESDTYGFNDRSMSAQTHRFWGEALLAYTLPKLKHSFYMNVTAGSSINADRLTSYRLGAQLPMAAEFPLSLPGYFNQEISARNFVLMGGNYIVPLDKRQRWNVSVTADTSVVDYLPGLSQPGNWNSGVGAGVFYTSPSWRVMVGYGYGIDAIRSGGRGANSIGILLQLDLEHAAEAFFAPGSPTPSRGLQRIFDVLGS